MFQAPPPQPFPTWKQAFVLFGGGLALAVSACFGCLFTLNVGRNGARWDVIPTFLAVVALAGLVLTGGGVVLVLMRILRALFGKKDNSGSPS